MPLRTIIAAVILSAWTLAARAGDVMVARVEGAIGPATARFMVEAIDRANETKAECLVFELDTPGGLDDSMRQIIKRMMASDVPVVVYVAPAGSRAASAGAFITLAAHVAAMAPGTAIGAAHPVNLGSSGEMETNMAAKVTHDAAAYIRSLAKKYGRNIEWANSAVRESVSLSETEALEKKVVDVVARTLDELLAAIDGRTVEMGKETVTLKTKGAKKVYFDMDWRDRFLSILANPNLAYILFMLGLLGLYFELSTPGAILPGVVGAICLVLAFFAFQTLSVNYAGMLLIILAIIMFILDVKAATHGALTIGGIVAMVIGSIMLFNAPDPALRASMSVIIPVVAVTAAFFALGVWLSIRAMLRKPTTGDAGLKGQAGDARTAVNKAGGTVFVAGAHWNAFSDAEIRQGARVRVVDVVDMNLKVEEVK